MNEVLFTQCVTVVYRKRMDRAGIIAALLDAGINPADKLSQGERDVLTEAGFDPSSGAGLTTKELATMLVDAANGVLLSPAGDQFYDTYDVLVSGTTGEPTDDIGDWEVTDIERGA